VKKLKSILLIAAFLIAATWFVAGSASFQACIEEAQKQAGDHSAPKGTAQFIGLLNVQSRCTGEFIHKNSEAIIAIFTVILGIATILLWAATRDLVLGADKTAERQLRAYIWTESKVSPNLDDPNFGVGAIARNSGQTPAYEVHAWSNVRPVAEPLPRRFVFPKAPEHIPGPRYVVNPSSEHLVHTTPENPLTHEERLAIKDGYLTLYFWGEVRYRDAFGQTRKTQFRLWLVGPGGNWAYCDEGNDAD